MLMTELRVPRQDDVTADILRPEACRGNDELLRGCHGLMSNGKEGNETGRDFPHPGICSERLIRNHVSRFMESEPKRSTGEEPYDVTSLGRNRWWGAAQHQQHGKPASRGTHVAAYRGEAQQLL